MTTTFQHLIFYFFHKQYKYEKYKTNGKVFKTGRDLYKIIITRKTCAMLVIKLINKMKRKRKLIYKGDSIYTYVQEAISILVHNPVSFQVR